MTHQFQVGEKVVFTNEFGVCWGVKTIKSLEPPITDGGPVYYHYENSDTPWYPVSENLLRPADEDDILHPECVHPADSWYETTWPYFQKKYGRETTKEELASLGWADPFDGET